MNPQIAISFIIYLGFLLAIGYLSHKKQTSPGEFIMGNRSLNFWLTALSAHASDMSNWLFMGYPAAVMLYGLSGSWIAIGLIIGMFINWQFVAKKLRLDTEKFQSYTLSTYFEKRLDDTSGFIRILTASMTIFFLTWYLSAGLIGMGLLFESVFGINYYVGLTLAVSVAVIYTTYGGFITVAWTDLFQALFLLFFILLVPIVTYLGLPEGAETIKQVALIQNIPLSLIPSYSIEFLLYALFMMAWGLGYWGQPHILTKFMGIKDANQIKNAKYLGMLWQIFSLGGATAVGLVGMAYFHGSSLANPELVFIEIVKTLFHPLVGGFVLCAILAATMSTMDSQILVCASVLSEDFYGKLVRKKASGKEKVIASRIGVLLIALTALLLAFQRSNTVLDTVQYAWDGLGSTFGPLLLMCLYSKNINRLGGIAGIVVGGLTSTFWHLINPCLTTICIPAMIPAFTLSLITIPLVSHLTRNKKAL